MKKNYKILLIEDEEYIRKGIELNLKEEGFFVKSYSNAEEFLTKEDYLNHFGYDLIIVDIMLPGKTDGIQFTKLIKSKWDVPLIILTAKNRLEHKLEAFEVGADDYITKPFELEELMARVKIKLKKKKFHKILIGNHIVDFENYKVENRKTKKIFNLTEKEIGILFLLYENKGKPVSRDKILDTLWKNEYPTNRTIDNFILKLRKILEEDPSNPKFILTRHKKGYELSSEIQEYK
ncbi:MAG: response regulator transcription factor [Leptonema sp. (in: bacteria)]